MSRFRARARRGLRPDDERIAPNIFHCTWSAPSAALINGETRILFAAGNGIVYGFKPVTKTPTGPKPANLEKVFQYDLDPGAPKTEVHRFTQNRREGPSNIYGMPVVIDGRLFIAGGGDVFWGKKQGASEHIGKPWNATAVEDLIKRYCR